MQVVIVKMMNCCEYADNCHKVNGSLQVQKLHQIQYKVARLMFSVHINHIQGVSTDQQVWFTVDFRFPGDISTKIQYN